MATIISTASKIRRHHHILSKYLEELANEKNGSLGNHLEYQSIADPRHHHYQLTKLGWLDQRHYFTVLMHFDIRPDGKIWIQQNNTEILVGPELEKRGVAKSDLVLGFRSEFMRQFSEYATA